MWSAYIVNYLFFVLKVFTLVLGVVITCLFVVVSSRRNKHVKTEYLLVKSLNDYYHKQKISISKEILSDNSFRKIMKANRVQYKKIQKQRDSMKRIFVVDFFGDIRASQVDNLAKEIDAILCVANNRDEVLIRLESSGGTVNGYGLASAQLSRIKEAGTKLIVAVDQVAASGGYMMASVADHIIASPFAIIGSIGVVAQIPNINRLLNSKGVDIELHTAGKCKRNLTMLGKNTEEGRVILREQLEDVHQLFKNHIVDHRPSLDIESVSNGQYWYGKEALSLNLVDGLITSDAYLFDKFETSNYQIFTVKYEVRKSKLSSIIRSLCRNVMRVGL